MPPATQISNNLRNADLRGPSNHAMNVVIADVDAVSARANHSDYKYKDKARQERSLELLSQQNNLRYKPNKGQDFTPYTGPKLRQHFERKFPNWTDDSLDDFWAKGSSSIQTKWLNDIRKWSKYAQKNFDVMPCGSVPAIWSYHEVEKTLQELGIPGTTAQLEASEYDEESIRSTPFSQHEPTTFDTPQAPASSKRRISDTSHSVNQGQAKVAKGKKEEVSLNETNKRQKTISSEGDEDQTVDSKRSSKPVVLKSTSVISEDEFSLDETKKMMEKLPRKVNDLAKELFEHFGLPQNLNVVFNAEESQIASQEVYRTCWGQDWHTVGKDNCKLLPACDAIRSLVSAYLYQNVFSADGSKWAALAKTIDENWLFMFLKHSIKPTLHKDQTANGVIASMVLNVDIKQLRTYHQLLTQSLPFRILDRDESRQEAARVVTSDLCHTLGPFVEQLAQVSQACNKFAKRTDWKIELQVSLTGLVDHALQIKRCTEPTSDRTFRFVWAEHGSQVDRDTMEAKAPNARSVPVVVMATLVPGLTFQQNEQEKTELVCAAEILEKLDGQKKRQPHVAETVSLD